MILLFRGKREFANNQVFYKLHVREIPLLPHIVDGTSLAIRLVPLNENASVASTFRSCRVKIKMNDSQRGVTMTSKVASLSESAGSKSTISFLPGAEVCTEMLMKCVKLLQSILT